MADKYTHSDALDDVRKLKNLYRPFEHFEQMLARIESAEGQENLIKKNVAELEKTKNQLEVAIYDLVRKKDSAAGEVSRLEREEESRVAQVAKVDDQLKQGALQLKAQEQALSKSTHELDEIKHKVRTYEESRRRDMAEEEGRHRETVDQLRQIKKKLDAEITKMETKREEYRREALGEKAIGG